MIINIRINSMNDATEVCRIINNYVGNYDLRCGHRVVDAKSILGIISLQIPGSMELSGDLPEELVKEIGKFRRNEK